jgi:hypothetical protein
MLWEWRDGESSVYPPYGNIRDDIWRWSIVLSGGAGPILILEDLGEG